MARLAALVTPLHALQSATINAADLLGVNDCGELKLGLFADITAMERVFFVMKGGGVFKQ
jgi:imidazolonepropionase-like amidohydrolase